MTSETPRTDAVVAKYIGRTQQDHDIWKEADELLTHSRTLERELATLTKERDEARRILSNWEEELRAKESFRSCNHPPEVVIGSAEGMICCECWAQQSESALRQIAALPTDQTAPSEQCAAVVIAMDALKQDPGEWYLENRKAKAELDAALAQLSELKELLELKDLKYTPNLTEAVRARIATERDSVLLKIAEYLSSGGLFNPELMPHNKVRDIIIESRTQIEKLRAALEFYANPEVYHAVRFIIDPPDGGWSDDFDEEHGHPDYPRHMPGKRARAALAQEPTK